MAAAVPQALHPMGETGLHNWCSFPAFTKGPSAHEPVSLAVALHIGYNNPVIIAEVMGYCNIVKAECVAQGVQCDVFVTVVENATLESVQKQGTVSNVQLIPNRGVDAVAFLQALGRADMVNWGNPTPDNSKGYSHVLKLHTKGHNGWRQALARGLIDRQESVQALLAYLHDPSVGMVGTCTLPHLSGCSPAAAAQIVVNELKWFKSEAEVQAASQASQFSGGAVFTARVDMMRDAFRAFDVAGEIARSPEGRGYQGQPEGRLHWLERIWGLSCVWYKKRYVPVGAGFCGFL